MDNKEQKKIVQEIIVDIVRKMLKREINAKWTGKKIDLFEMIQIAYQSMQILREDGMPMTMSEMIRNIFEWQQLTVGNNIFAYGNRLNARKGILAKSLEERMQYLIFNSNVKAEPLLLLRKLNLITDTTVK